MLNEGGDTFVKWSYRVSSLKRASFLTCICSYPNNNNNNNNYAGLQGHAHAATELDIVVIPIFLCSLANNISNKWTRRRCHIVYLFTMRETDILIILYFV